MDEQAETTSRGALRATFACGALALLFCGMVCGGSEKRVRSPNLAEPCTKDQTREFFCDDLVPSTGVPAPAPYEACPWTIDYATGDYEPAPAVAVFDAAHTEYLRKRAPPGHACCYGFCSKLQVQDPTKATDQEDCQTNAAFREEYCIGEPEGGTSLPAPGYAKCPAALVPPAKAVFSSPKAALFDSGLTAQHRTAGDNACCYAWCSQAPPGSGLEHRVHPNSR